MGLVFRKKGEVVSNSVIKWIGLLVLLGVSAYAVWNIVSKVVG